MTFDRNNTVDLLTLQTEVNTDPNGYGYDGTITQAGVLDPINLKRDTITVSLPTINTKDIIGAIYFEAYNNISIDEQEWIRWITNSAESLNMTQDLRDRLTGVLGGSVTGDSIWAAADDDIMEPIMLALIDVDGSRAEELFGQGTSISRDDWIAARDYVG